MSRYERVDDDPNNTGFRRFTSLDPRFPIAISFPGFDYFYDMNDEAQLIFMAPSGASDLTVQCEDLQLLGSRGISPAQAVVNGSRSMTSYGKEVFDGWVRSGYSSVDRYQFNEGERGTMVVGSGASSFHASTITWKTKSGTDGARVFFTRKLTDVTSSHPSSYKLWVITFHPSRELRPHWQTILSSFQWL
jgi:hypothetical protein